MLLADYIKHVMQEYHTIFPTRFSVLDHLFATNGNGITLKDGYIMDFETRQVKEPTRLSREEIIQHVKDSSDYRLGWCARVIKEIGDEYPEATEKLKKRLESHMTEDERTIERLCNIDEAYKIQPDLTRLEVYAWGGSRRYIPMYDFEKSKYDDTIEQLEYFRDCIVNATPYELTEDSSDTEKFYARGVLSWKENVGEIDKIIKKLRK
ncbi:hypothetical protein vBValMR11Z_73 [Vibrio phage vB_ValM_R11Z]|nr:hypothetical protein vBValMR11Z_73 [Vibrio phage vB_ValM_R11Z]